MSRHLPDPNKQTFLLFFQVRPHNNYVYNKLKIIGNKEGLDINQRFINRLNIEYIVGM